VFATGFDAMMGFIEIDIRGRDGRTPKEKWEDGPRA
jgi:cyclohexanone monooxygenase/phenylacetone monooxygenase